MNHKQSVINTLLDRDDTIPSSIMMINAKNGNMSSRYQERTAISIKVIKNCNSIRNLPLADRAPGNNKGLILTECDVCTVKYLPEVFVQTERRRSEVCA